MTVTDEVLTAAEPTEDVPEATTPEADTGNDSGDPDKDNRDRDFTKYRKLHSDLANYVNEHSGLEPVTANQVKAILYLRPDFNNTPEQAAERQARKDKKEAEEARYKGLTDDQKKKVKAADRTREQADRMAKRAAEAQAEAEAVLAQANPGEDIASQVEQTQAEVETVEPEPDRKRGIGRRNR
jgi:hypothetical protein